MRDDKIRISRSASFFQCDIYNWLGISILIVDWGIQYFKITCKFAKCGQVRQNIFLLVTDVIFFNITHGILYFLLSFEF